MEHHTRIQIFCSNNTLCSTPLSNKKISESRRAGGQHVDDGKRQGQEVKEERQGSVKFVHPKSSVTHNANDVNGMQFLEKLTATW